MVDSPADDTTNAPPLGSRVTAAVGTFGLLLIVCLGPLPYGSVLVRERAVLQICAFLALAAVLAGRRLSPLPTLTRVPPAMIAAIGLWGICQSLPLPRFVVEILAPRIADGWDRAAPLLAEASASPSWVTLSLAPSVSRATGLHWLAIAAAMAAAMLLGTDRRARRLVVGGFLTVAVFEVFFGAEKWLGRSEVLWGLEVAGDPGRLRGTFVNANHLAFYLTIASALILSWLWWSVRRVIRRQAIEQLLLTLVPGLGFLVLMARAPGPSAALRPLVERGVISRDDAEAIAAAETRGLGSADVESMLMDAIDRSRLARVQGRGSGAAALRRLFEHERAGRMRSSSSWRKPAQRSPRSSIARRGWSGSTRWPRWGGATPWASGPWLATWHRSRPRPSGCGR